VDPPANISVTNTSAYSLFIEWDSPNTPNGIIVNYTIYLDYNNGTTDVRITDFNTTVYLLEGLLFLDTQSWQDSEKDDCMAEIKSKKKDPRTWAVPGQFGPDKAQTWVSEPAARGENSVLHPPEVLPTREVSPAFWPNLHTKSNRRRGPSLNSMYERGEAENTKANWFFE